MGEQLVPVASPTLLKRFKLNTKQADKAIEELPLLQHSTRPQSWEEWFKARNFAPRRPEGPTFEHFHMLISAAIAGLGVALVPLVFVKDELESNRLVRLGPDLLESDRAYYLIYPPEQELRDSRRTFSKWLQKQDG